MSSPVALALAFFSAGVVAVQMLARLPPGPGALAALGGSSLIALAWRCSAPSGTSRHTRERAGYWVCVAVSAATLGVGYAAWRAELRLADALPRSVENVDVRIVGVVDDLPQNGADGARFAVRVESILRPEIHVPRRISLAWFPPRADDDDAPDPPEVRAGERWRLTVRLKRPHGNVNPAGFDLEAWLLERDLRATGTVREDRNNARLTAFVGSLGDHVQRARESIRERIKAALPDAPYAGVLVALAVGDQRAIPEAQWRVFNRTGVSHLISISGLHVTVFSTFAAALAFVNLRRITRLTSRIPARKLAVAVGAACAFGYVLLAGAEVPAVRTLLMLWVGAVGVWLARPGTASLVWLWGLAAVLLWDPWASLAPGFWLSFGAVGLLLYAGTGRLAVAASRKLRTRMLNSLRESAHAQWVVTLGLVPGTLALFQQVSVVSAAANAIAIPLVTLAVVPLVLIGLALPFDFVWQVAHALFAALMVLLEAMAAWPAAAWTQHAPPSWTIVAATVGVVLLLAPRGVPGRWLGACWLLPMFLVLPERPPPGAARLTVLDVGQGLAIVVETHRHVVVYDTGPALGETTDAGRRWVAPFLRVRGVRNIDALVVSHADLDHAGGAISLLDEVPVTTLYSSLHVNHPIVARASTRGTAWRCEDGMRWQWDDVRFEFLAPPVGRYARVGMKTNDMSCVLRISARGGRALLAGDVEALGEAELLRDHRTSLAADVLVVPHHGSRTSSTPSFVAAVAPAYAVFSAGYLNRFNHPRPEVVARYERRGAAALRTDRAGAITLMLGPDNVAASGERERRRRYWYDDAPPTIGEAP